MSYFLTFKENHTNFGGNPLLELEKKNKFFK